MAKASTKMTVEQAKDRLAELAKIPHVKQTGPQRKEAKDLRQFVEDAVEKKADAPAGDEEEFADEGNEEGTDGEDGEGEEDEENEEGEEDEENEEGNEEDEGEEEEEEEEESEKETAPVEKKADAPLADTYEVVTPLRAGKVTFQPGEQVNVKKLHLTEKDVRELLKAKVIK